MKGVFKGYKSKGSYEFTVGKVYELIAGGFEAYEYVIVKVEDDAGFLGLVILGDIYDFEIIKHSPFVVEGDHFKVNQTGIKYYINNNLVTKETFDEVRGEVLELTISGVKTSSIKFEVKFE